VAAMSSEAVELPSGEDQGGLCASDPTLVCGAELDTAILMESRGWTSAPEEAFSHVEAAADTGIREGMVLEAAVQEGHHKEEESFWLAEVKSVHGHFLRLRWLRGGGQRGPDFWRDLTKGLLYPLGWAQQKGRTIRPPAIVSEAMPDWQEIVKAVAEDGNVLTMDAHHVEGNGSTPAERLKPGQRLELRDEHDPLTFWPAEIVSANGGLLELEYCTGRASDDSVPVSGKIFFTSNRLRPLGYAGEHRRELGTRYSPPAYLRAAVGDRGGGLFAARILAEQCQSAPAGLLCGRVQPETTNKVKKGQVAEVLLPNGVATATVAKVWSSHFFELQLEDDRRLLCSNASDNVFPIGWTSKNLGCLPCTSLNVPEGESIAHAPTKEGCESASDVGLAIGQKLEVLHENQQLLSATIRAVAEHILALELDTDMDEKRQVLISRFSWNIFPFGWAQTVGLSCLVPKSFASEANEELIKAAKEEKAVKKEETLLDDQQYSWCPPIYFNYQCSASFMSRARLAALPKSVGPGNVTLVVKKVLELVVGASYKSGAVLKRLERMSSEKNGDDDVYDQEGDKEKVEERRLTHRFFVKQSIKGKSRVHNLKGEVDLPSRTADVADFCREVCERLGSCQHLISTKLHVNGASDCPAQCQTKNRMDAAGQEENLAPRKRGRKKKYHSEAASSDQKPVKTSSAAATAAASSSNSDDETEDPANSAVPSRCPSPDPAANQAPSAKKKSTGARASKWESILPRSDIQTRGAKLPDFKLHFGLKPSKRSAEANTADSPEKKAVTEPAVAREDAWKMEAAFRLEDIGRPEGVSPAADSASYEQPLQPLRAFGGPPRLVSSVETSHCPTLPGPVQPTLPPPLPQIRPLTLNKNPAEWTSRDTAVFLASTPDCAHLASFMIQDEVDGPSFMLLNYPTAVLHWSLSVRTAVRLCRHVESVKLAYLKQ